MVRDPTTSWDVGAEQKGGLRSLDVVELVQPSMAAAKLFIPHACHIAPGPGFLLGPLWLIVLSPPSHQSLLQGRDNGPHELLGVHTGLCAS